MDEDDKQVDLHDSEWRREGKREPVLGPNGMFFLIMFPLSIFVYYVVSWFFIDLLGFPTGR